MYVCLCVCVIERVYERECVDEDFELLVCPCGCVGVGVGGDDFFCTCV